MRERRFLESGADYAAAVYRAAAAAELAKFGRLQDWATLAAWAASGIMLGTIAAHLVALL